MIVDTYPALPMVPGAATRAIELSLRTTGEFDAQDTVVQHVSRLSLTGPDRVAIRDGEALLTYSGLLARVERICRVLRAEGHGSGEVIAAVGDRSAESIALFLALEHLGLVYVPIDCDWPQQRVAEVLRRAGAVRLVDYSAASSDSDRSTAAVKAAIEVGVPISVAPEAGGDAWTGHRREVERANEARYCIFTSGTTGRPKGAIVQHRGMVNHLQAKITDLELTSEDILAFTAPLVFDISIWQMLTPLLIGGCIEVITREDMLFPRPFVSRLERAGVTVVELVPAVAGWIAAEAQRTRRDILPRLRWLISTGEELPVRLAEHLLHALPRGRLLNAYGPTECSDDVTHHEVTAEDLGASRLPVGAPIANAHLYLLTREADGRWRAAEPAEAGELFVGGPVVGLGYVNDAENTAAAFFRDPFDEASPTGRLYRTGDAARFDDGVVLYLGRLDRQVKISGIRMELDEIEAVLGRHPAIDACAVTVTGEQGRSTLSAHYTLRRPVPADELREHLAAALPEAMVPRRYIELERIPLTANGKINHEALRGGPAAVAGPGHASS